MASVALITCVDLPEADPDQIPLLKAFEAAGVQAKMLAWDDAGADVQAFDVCVLRSCWNYYLRPEALEIFQFSLYFFLIEHDNQKIPDLE